MADFYELRRLAKDIRNPRPDRRCKRSFRDATVWKKGSTLRITTESTGGFAGLPIGELRRVNTPRGDLDEGLDNGADVAIYQLLIAGSERLELDTSKLVGLAHAPRQSDYYRYRAIVFNLVRDGRIDLEQMADMLAEDDLTYETDEDI